MENRFKLNFEEEATVAFHFLEKEYGFSRTLSATQKVRYESKKAFIEINHGGYDFEISIAFGRLNMSEPEQFDFTLFLRLVNPSLEKSLGERIADKPDTVRETVRKVAAAFRSEGIDIINGNEAIFNRMKTVAWWQFKPDTFKG